MKTIKGTKQTLKEDFLFEFKQILRQIERLKKDDEIIIERLVEYPLKTKVYYRIKKDGVLSELKIS